MEVRYTGSIRPEHVKDWDLPEPDMALRNLEKTLKMGLEQLQKEARNAAENTLCAALAGSLEEMFWVEFAPDGQIRVELSFDEAAPPEEQPRWTFSLAYLVETARPGALIEARAALASAVARADALLAEGES